MAFFDSSAQIRWWFCFFSLSRVQLFFVSIRLRIYSQRSFHTRDHHLPPWFIAPSGFRSDLTVSNWFFFLSWLVLFAAAICSRCEIKQNRTENNDYWTIIERRLGGRSRWNFSIKSIGLMGLFMMLDDLFVVIGHNDNYAKLCLIFQYLTSSSCWRYFKRTFSFHQPKCIIYLIGQLRSLSHSECNRCFSQHDISTLLCCAFQNHSERCVRNCKLIFWLQISRFFNFFDVFLHSCSIDAPDWIRGRENDVDSWWYFLILSAPSQFASIKKVNWNKSSEFHQSL